MVETANWQFWIDRGGTFTDIVAFRSVDGLLRRAKVRSDDPAREEDAALAAIREVLGLSPSAPLDDLGAVRIRMGTTVATNALLTRQGAPTVVVLTAGLGALLLLGDQTRPHLFKLDIRRPQPCWHSIIEATERIALDGSVITPLDQQQVRTSLSQARSQGATACAIALMHGWSHEAHEQEIATIARDIGFEEVVASHEICPIQGLLARSQTTLIDAMLTPPLWASIAQLQRALPRACLEFMQSSGGLTDSDGFRGARAVLSGPAGGIVAAASLVEEGQRIVTFDMGGTSTDVAWYQGRLERTWSTRIEGLRLRVPMLEIDSIAAGGGSVCRFDGERLRVGPQSAGSDPGPACYRGAGPATVTDCHVVLGRLDGPLLPSVFGPGRNCSIDVEASRLAFEAIARHMREASGLEVTLEEAAEGCLRVAVARMAAAIRHVSIEQGRSLEGVTLVSFGGAGGQVTCAVADALGIERVLVHPLAGVLSAMGIGLAQPRASAERTLNCKLDADDVIKRACDSLEASMRAEIAGSGSVRIRRRVHVQVRGWDGTLAVDLASVDLMRRCFADAALHRFGFEPPLDDLMAAMVEVEVEAEDVPSLPALRAAQGPLPAADRRVQCVMNGQRMDVDVRHRANLPAGATIAGPVIIAEAGATTVVESGWSLTCQDDGVLILTRAHPVSRETSIEAKRPDPAMLEVFGSRFMAIAEDMGATLRRTAHSVNIKERLDYSCALFDACGNLVANGPHMPVHLGSMDDSVHAVIEAAGEDVHPGDVWLLNDPFQGGTHLPDLTVVSPVHLRAGPPNFWVASRGHHADIGGLTPGSMPAHSRTLDDEGVCIAPMRIVHAGQFDEAIVRARLASSDHPARHPDQNVADLRAQLAANARGHAEIARLVDEHGLDVVRAYSNFVIDNGEACVRRLIATLQPGGFECPMDNGSVVCLAVRSEGDELVFDFTGTSPQCETNFNAPPSVTRAAVLYVLRCLIDDDIPLNQGCLRPVRIVIPPGSILNPVSPAAVVAGNVETSQIVVDTVLAALGVQAASQGTMNNLTFGDDACQYYETICGGTGAGPTFDGTDAVHSHMTNSRLTDPEVLEDRYPVRLERFSIRSGTGGRGRHAGGAGAVREIRALVPLTFTLLSGRRRLPPHGLGGGEPAQGGSQFILRCDGTRVPIEATSSNVLLPGDRFVVMTPGGGGCGEIGPS